jgi:hypothetical protein
MVVIVESEQESRRQWMMHQFAYYGRINPNNKDWQIWSNDNHPEECFTNGFMKTKLNYIHENPVRAGIVAKPEDFLYSSASNYVTGKGLLDVELL